MLARLATLPLVVIAVAAITTGCGGGEEQGVGAADDDRTTSSLSKDEFIMRAQAICRSEKRRTPERLTSYDRERPGSASPSDEAPMDRFKAVQLPVIESSLSALRELGIPSEDGDALEAFLEAEQEAAEIADTLNGVATRAEIEERFAAAARLAQAYGIPGCGNGVLVEG